jgi:dTDP-4-dehydrorhamnose reductase
VLGVDACEANPILARAVNVLGAENVAKAAAAVDADFVQLSSNYVFDGKREAFYTSHDAPNPINIYGQTKLQAERVAQAACPETFIVRTSWVFGNSKQNFFSTVPKSLRSGQRCRAITDVWASATYVSDLVTRAIEIVSLKRYGSYHVVNSDVCSYHDFAVEAAHVLRIPSPHLKDLIDPIKSSNLSLPAARPRYTPLKCEASEEIGLPPLRSWREALAAYIQTL